MRAGSPGWSRRTFYYHYDKWPDFAAACEGQLARAAGAIEALAWERATIGAEEVTIRGGEVVQVRRKPSDAMLRLLLQASNPKKYGRMAAARRKAIERELRAKIAAEEDRKRRPRIASNEEVRDALVKRLAVFAARQAQAARAEAEASGGDGDGDGEAREGRAGGGDGAA